MWIEKWHLNIWHGFRKRSREDCACIFVNKLWDTPATFHFKWISADWLSAHISRAQKLEPFKATSSSAFGFTGRTQTETRTPVSRIHTPSNCRSQPIPQQSVVSSLTSRHLSSGIRALLLPWRPSTLPVICSGWTLQAMLCQLWGAWFRQEPESKLKNGRDDERLRERNISNALSSVLASQRGTGTLTREPVHCQALHSEMWMWDVNVIASRPLWTACCMLTSSVQMTFWIVFPTQQLRPFCISSDWEASHAHPKGWALCDLLHCAPF